MYNQNLKEQYIAERENEVILPANYLNRQFEKVAIMEEELGKDVSNFTVYEIIEYYKMLNLTVLDCLLVMNSQFSLYTQWCLQNNLVKDNQNHYLEVTIEYMNGCLNKALLNMKFINIDTITKWISQLPNPKDQFVLLGLYEGIKGKDFCELAKLRPEDINGNVAKLCTGREMKISDTLINIIDECLNEDTYYSTTGNGVKKMPLVYKGFIIKDYPNTKEGVSDFQIGRKIYNGITRTLNYFGVLQYMSANSIVESGKINMIKNRAKEFNMSAREYLYSDYIKEVEEKYNCSIVKSTYWIKYQDYLM